jgi:hypothetical protein
MFVQAKPTNAAESQWGDFITLWDYSATVCVADTRSRLFTPIALLTGILIVPFRESEDFGIEPIGDDGFADHMDAHSAWMNDVWRELAFGYIPNKGVGGVSELVEEKGDPGFLVIDVELAQEYRGKDLVPSLLRMLVSAFNDRGTTSLFSAYSLDLRADGGSANEVRDFDFEDDDVGRAGVYRGISLASPIVLVFPVSGSEPGPDSGSPADILLAYTNARVQPSKKDAKAEAFKAKLTPHFRSMAEKVGLDVVVYDPWEHPIT